ncbi:MAG: hypothetical protein DHS20C06_19990 [Hyphobacterium sp.]|nr:MAG: hypothetical protein DHS20C06_19990 [Hyphobacterium sp.]
MTDFSLTEAAISDLSQISRYTIERWGKRQAGAYINEIFETFAMLAKFPALAPIADEYFEGRVFYHLHHFIVFREAENRIEILRIVHERMRR